MNAVNEFVALWRKTWFRWWVFAPLIGFLVSSATLWFIILVYPLVIAIVQENSMSKHPAARKTKLWYVSGLLYLPFLGLLGLIDINKAYGWFAINVSAESFASLIFAYGVFLFLFLQGCMDILMKPMFNTWRYGWWLGGNIVAGFVWGLLLYACTYFKPNGYEFLVYYVAILLCSFVSNAITGYALHLATREEKG